MDHWVCDIAVAEPLARFALVPVVWPVACDEVGQVVVAERPRLQGEVHVRPQVVVPDARWLDPASLVYVSGAVDETFTSADFRYGPHTAKPGPGNGWTLPFWSGQDINEPNTAQLLMFIDLNLDNTSDRSAIDSGSAMVEFDIEGLYETHASFNVYAWALNANVANGSINWTNRISTNPNEAGQSGYSIVCTAQFVPKPASAALVLLGLGVATLASVRRQSGSGGRRRRAAVPWNSCSGWPRW